MAALLSGAQGSSEITNYLSLAAGGLAARRGWFSSLHLYPIYRVVIQGPVIASFDLLDSKTNIMAQLTELVALLQLAQRFAYDLHRRSIAS